MIKLFEKLPLLGPVFYASQIALFFGKVHL
jgi:hypothetical protein